MPSVVTWVLLMSKHSSWVCTYAKVLIILPHHVRVLWQQVWDETNVGPDCIRDHSFMEPLSILLFGEGQVLHEGAAAQLTMD